MRFLHRAQRSGDYCTGKRPGPDPGAPTNSLSPFLPLFPPPSLPPSLPPFLPSRSGSDAAPCARARTDGLATGSTYVHVAAQSHRRDCEGGQDRAAVSGQGGAQRPLAGLI